MLKHVYRYHFEEAEFNKEYAKKYNLDTQQLEAIKNKILRTNERGICRYCKQKVNPISYKTTITYWGSYIDICHAECKSEGATKEAYECQLIDTNCNECKYFFRIKSTGNGTFKGWCNKFNRTTRAESNSANVNNTDCFEHRKGE